MDVYLSWDANDEPDLDHYNVYWGRTSACSDGSQEVTEPEVLLTGLPDRVSVYITVTAVDTEDAESERATPVVFLNKAVAMTTVPF